MNTIRNRKKDIQKRKIRIMKIGNGEQKLQECEEIKRRSMISVSEYGKETTR